MGAHGDSRIVSDDVGVFLVIDTNTVFVAIPHLSLIMLESVKFIVTWAFYCLC